MGGFKKIGTGNVSAPTSEEQTNTSTGGFKRIEGWTGAKPATPATPAAPAAPKVDISVLRKNLDDAKKAEEVALKNVNDYVSFHVGNLDMQDPAELQGLKDTATAATKKREQLEKEYYAHEDSVEDQFEGFGKVGRAVSTIIAKPFLAVDVAAQTAGHAAKGEEMDMDTLAMQKFGRLNEAQESVTEGMSDTGKFLTNTAMSIGQNLYSLPLNVIMPFASAVSMGVTTAADKMHELGTQGESATRALVRGGISGGIEAATEAIPLGTLADLIKTGGKGVVKNLLKQGGVEAVEEGISYTANYIADKLAKDPNAKWDWGEFWTSVGSGGLSGLFFGTSGTVVGNIKNGQSGTQGGTDQKPAAGVNLPGAGTNGAEVGVGAAEQKNAPNAIDGAEAEDYYFDPNEKNISWRKRMYSENEKTYIQSQDLQRMYEVPSQSEIEYFIQDDGTITLKNDVFNNVFDSDYRDFVKAYSDMNLITHVDPKTGEEIDPKPIIIKDDGARVVITQTGINDVAKKIRSAGLKSRDNVSSILLLNRIIENSKRDSPADNKHGKKTQFTNYKARFSVGGRPYDVVINIKNATQGDRYHYHTLENIKVEPTDGSNGADSTGTYQASSTFTDPTVPQAEQGVKGQSVQDGAELSPQQAQATNIMVSNIVNDARSKGVDLTAFYDATRNMDIYNMKRSDVPTLVSALRSVVDAVGANEVNAGYLDKINSYGETTTASGYGQNTVGAAQAQFPYQEAPSQSVADNLFTEQELQERNLRSKHQVFTNAEGRSIAAQMLANDYDGEVQRLQTDEWGPVENVEGHMILEDLVEKARQSKSDADWAEVKKWKKLYDQKGGTDAAQTLQSRAQFANSSTNIVADAVEFLDGPEARRLPRTRRAEVIDIVDRQATTYEAIEEGDVDSLIKLIEQNNEIRRTTGLFAKETAKQLDWALREVANKYPDSAEKFLRDVAASQIRNISLDYKKVGATEAAKTIRIMNMLSKASTVMRNLVSNNVFDPLESLSGNVGIIADALMSKATGNRTTAVDKSWFSKTKRSGSLEAGLKSYIEVALDAPVDGAASRYEGVDGDRVFKMQGNFVERLLSTWSKYQSYALRTTDEFQKGGIAAETQRGIDKLTAQGKLGEGMLPGWAEETAKQRTFQNKSAVAQAMVKGRDALNSLHVGSVGAGDILLPFAKVPGNLVSQAGNYSPLGLAKSFKDVVEVMVDAKKGNYDAQKQAQAARNFGRGVSGTALLGLFTTLALKGLIDVAGADDKDKEALEKAQGKTGTQWNLSATLRALGGKDTTWQDGDTLMSIGFLEPLNAVMAAGALIADDYEDDGHVNLVDVALSSLGALWQAVLDLPAMTSINDLINTYNYAEGETDGDKLANAALEYAGSQVSSFLLPNAIRGIATGLDDTVRNQYAGETIAEGVIDSFKSGIPGLRQTLPASLDPLGRERTQTGSTVLNMLNNNLLPGAITTYKETAVESTLADVYDSTGEAGIYPNKSAPSSVSVDGDPYPLTPERKDTYVRTAGQVAAEIMGGMAGSKNFTQAGNADKAAYLSLANQYARAIAANRATNGLYKLDGFAKKATEAERQGVPASDFLMFYNDAKKYDADGNGSMKITETAAAIQNSGLSRNDQMIMWGLYYPDWTAKASEAGVDFGDLVQYKVVTNRAGATKKDQKIAALQAAGYSYEKAVDLYNKLK